MTDTDRNHFKAATDYISTVHKQLADIRTGITAAPAGVKPSDFAVPIAVAQVSATCAIAEALLALHQDSRPMP